MWFRVADLTAAISILKKKLHPNKGSDYDSMSSVSADSDPDLHPSEEIWEPNLVPTIGFIASQICDQIDSLYHLSDEISDSTFSMRGQGGNGPLQEFFRKYGEYDYNYVREKLLCWRKQTQARTPTQTQEESQETITAGNHFSDLPSDTEFLIKRLAEGNTRRREQL